MPRTRHRVLSKQGSHRETRGRQGTRRQSVGTRHREKFESERESRCCGHLGDDESQDEDRCGYEEEEESGCAEGNGCEEKSGYEERSGEEKASASDGVSTAVYEWNYTRQMLHIRLIEAGGGSRQEELKEIFGPDFLISRPLLQAIDPSNTQAPVLLIDELDRSDEEFEAYLLELLSDFQITIPEIGTIQARETPIVIITSNRTREIQQALRRRCLYYMIDLPSLEKE